MKREDGDITASRTIQTPSGSVVITGTLTEVDRIYRQLAKSLLQSGYSLTPLTKTEPAPPGNGNIATPSDDEVAEQKRTIDRLVDEGMQLINENRSLHVLLHSREETIATLESKVASLETLLNNVTSGPN